MTFAIDLDKVFFQPQADKAGMNTLESKWKMERIRILSATPF